MGIICNDNGNWVKGFSRSSGNASCMLAEIWAIRDGLELARDLGITHIVVELEAKRTCYASKK